MLDSPLDSPLGPGALRGFRIADAALEAAYRHHQLREDARASAFFCVLAALIMLLFVPTDWRLTGGTPVFGELLGMRLVYIALVLGGAVIQLRTRSPALLSTVTFALLLALLLQAIPVGATRPRDFYFNLSSEVAIVAAFWALLPLPFSLQALLSLTHAGLTATVLTRFREPLALPAALAVWGGFILATVAGAAMSFRLQRARRLQYLTLREETRHRQALEEALARVEQLEGILPICAHCKNIREPDGTWVPIERYLGRRSNAEFSHGLCQACYDRHYGDLGP